MMAGWLAIVRGVGLVIPHTYHFQILLIHKMELQLTMLNLFTNLGLRKIFNFGMCNYYT